MKLLIVIDMQNDFVTGALGSPEAQAIAERVAERICAAAREGEQVIFTQDTHGADYAATHEGRLLPVAHCLRGSEGWRLAPAIEAARAQCPGARTVEKATFGSVELAHSLAAEAASAGLSGGRGVDIELCGLCTDICVVSNALLLRAALPEAELSVRAELCAGVTPAKHEAALEVMRSCQVQVL